MAEEKKELTLAEEAGLPETWHPIDSDPIVPNAAPPRPNPMASLYGGSISPTLQHDKVFVDTQYGSSIIAKLPLMPLSSSSQPTVGAAIQSVSKVTIVSSSNAVAAGPNGAVQFNNGGPLGGSVGLKWDNINNVLNVGGNLTVTGSLSATINGTATIFNASTGFQVGGAAAVGKYLRGNGTVFTSATLSGSDVLAGIVGVTYGGTGANLSATGGASQVVRQSSVGAVFTVSQLAASDLTNGTTGSGAVVLATAPTVNGLTFPTAAGSAVVAQLIASGTATLGTTLITATSSATTVTVSAPGTATTDSIEWAFNAAPGAGYTSGLFVQAYVSSGNVNFIVTNPTAGSLTPAAATLNFRVIR